MLFRVSETSRHFSSVLISHFFLVEQVKRPVKLTLSFVVDVICSLLA